MKKKNIEASLQVRVRRYLLYKNEAEKEVQ